MCSQRVFAVLLFTFCADLLSVQVRSDAYYGEGGPDLDIFFLGIECQESHTKLYECTILRNTGALCTHAEDVGVICNIGACAKWDQSTPIFF